MHKMAEILVVDDDETNRELLRRRLARQGFEVTTAMDGRDALARLNAKPFDLVLLDILMPQMDGHQALQQMKASPALRHIPVIMISALDDLQSLVRCIEDGADDYLTKPFDPVLLKARIGACLEKKRLRDQEQLHLKQLEIYLHQIQAEQLKSEKLLLNVLPKAIAQRLKDGEEAIADNFAEVTVLFADLVGFTSLSSAVAPAELVKLLNEIFSAFDALAARHGLEKIKTIGDAYMAVSGLPAAREDHAEAAARMALDIQTELEQFNRDYRTNLRMRIGLHSGPVIAGIIGRNKFAYDLWGDTVNIASRMESHGIAGTVQVSERTYLALADRFELSRRGELDVKGRGTMVTYLLTGRKG